MTTEKTIVSDHVEFIRGEVREEINMMRKQKRYLKLNQNRTALGELNENENLTKEFVTNMALSLKKKPLKIQEYRKLQNALLQSENHINAFFKVEHAIHGLIRDLSSVSTQSKLSAANCCCNLALGNSKACNTLCKFAAPYLIAELESTNKPLAEVCAWTLGNLICGSNEAFHILHAQNCLKSLIKMALQSQDENVPAVSYALLRYIHVGHDSIQTNDIIELGKVIKRYPAVTDLDYMWLIALLSSKPEFQQDFINSAPAFCDYLLESILKEDESIEKISATLRIICNIVSEPSGQAAHYLFRQGTKKNTIFIGKLLSCQYIHIRHESLWLLGNLFNHSMITVQQIITPNILSSMPLKLAVNTLKETI